MGLLLILALAGLAWTVVAAVVLGLCWSAKTGDRVSVEEPADGSEPAERFRRRAS